MAGPIRISILANGAQARREMNSTARAATGLGRTLKTAAAVAGFGALAYKAGQFVKSSIELEAKFGQTMNTIAAATGAPAREMSKLNDLAIKLGQDTSFSASDAADAMLELAKAGIDTKTIMGGGLSGTLTLAAAGGTELGTAATIASNAMNTFNLKGRDMASVAAALAGGANASSASVESLGQGLQQVGPGARNAGLSLQETVAALSAFDAAGVKGSDAGTSLKTMLARLVPQTDKADSAMRDLGLHFTDAQGNFASLTSIAEQLHDGLKGLSDSARTQALNNIFGSDASRAAIVLGNEGADGIRKYIKAVEDQGAAEKMAKARMSGTAGALERLSGSVETAKLKLGQELAPAVQTGADYLSKNLVPAMDAVIDGGKQLGHAVAPAVDAIATALGHLLPSADDTASIFEDKLVPAVSTLSDIVADVVGFLDGLPGPIKTVGIEAGIAALVFPRLSAGFSAMTASVTSNIAKLQQWRAEMTYAETRTQNLTSLMSRLGGAAKAAAGVGGMVALTEGAKTSNDAMGILLNTLGGAATGFALGGPIGALIGGAGGGLLGIYQAAKKADDAASSFQTHWEGVRDTLDQVTGATTRTTRAFAYDELVRTGAIKTLGAYGISTRTAVSAILNEKGAREQVMAAVRSEAAQRKAALQQVTELQREYDSVVGSGAEEELKRAQILKLIDSYQAEADSHKKVIDDIRDGIGTIRADARAVRERAAASESLADLFPRLNKGAIVKIKALGIDPTRKNVMALARQLNLTARERRVLLRVTGVKEASDGVHRVNKNLRDVARVKPDAGPWLKGLDIAADRGAKSAQQGGKKVQKGLEQGPKGAKADLSNYISDVRTGTTHAKSIGSSGGQEVGAALKAGIIAGFAGTQALLAAQAAAAVRAAVTAARREGQVHSPSRKFREIGEYLGEGLLVGMAAREARSKEAGRRLVSSALAGARTGASGSYRPGSKALDAYMSTAAGSGRSGGRGSLAGLRIEGHIDVNDRGEGYLRGVIREEIEADRRFDHVKTGR